MWVCFRAVADDVKNSCLVQSVKHSRWTAAHWESKPPTPTVDQITDFSKFSHIKEKFQPFCAHYAVALQLFCDLLHSLDLHCLFLIPSTPFFFPPRMPFDNPQMGTLCRVFRRRWREKWWQRSKSENRSESFSVPGARCAARLSVALYYFLLRPLMAEKPTSCTTDFSLWITVESLCRCLENTFGFTDERVKVTVFRR